MQRKWIKMSPSARKKLQRYPKLQMEQLLLHRGSGSLHALQQLMERHTIKKQHLLKR